jgi:hypothetical protein
MQRSMRVLVVGLTGGQAVVQAAEEAVEQVALCSGLPTPMLYVSESPPQEPHNSDTSG